MKTRGTLTPNQRRITTHMLVKGTASVDWLAQLMRLRTKKVPKKRPG